jgi:hypothetical protein
VKIVRSNFQVMDCASGITSKALRDHVMNQAFYLKKPSMAE